MSKARSNKMRGPHTTPNTAGESFTRSKTAGRDGRLSHRAHRRAKALWLVACAAFTLAGTHATAGENSRELYRIRIANTADGLVQVSIDGGQSFYNVGRVIAPASTSIRGYSASVYARTGTIAAIAVHGLRIKTDEITHGRMHVPYIVSIVPLEFAGTPGGFGGHISGPSGIYTDIPTGTAIFRNFAPFVGNSVFLESGNDLAPLPRGYKPRPGHVLQIVVRIPRRYPKEIIFENRAGGRVEAKYPDDSELIGKVVRPVKGVGRFDATGYTGIGRINTNHGGVITISTAPMSNGPKDGSSLESRGGFQIQPSNHARQAIGMPQVLVVGPTSEGKPRLEGRPPLFSDCIGLTHDRRSDDDSFRTEIKTSKSGWIDLPALVGKLNNALVRVPGAGEVTHIRILFPTYAENMIARQMAACRQACVDLCKERARREGRSPVRGIVEFDLGNIEPDAVKLVSLYVDSLFRGMMNTPPYVFSLNTAELPEGEHVIELRAAGKTGSIVKRIRTKILVLHGGNRRKP